MTLSTGAGRASLNLDKINRGVFVRIAADDVIRVWTGRSKIRLPANDLDGTSQIYYGLGLIQDLPEFDRLINGDAVRVSVTLAGAGRDGVGQEIANLIDSSAVGLENSRVRFGQLRYDRLWRPTGALRWVWDGVLDEIGTGAVQDGQDAHKWTINLTLSSALVDRNVTQLTNWTPKDRRAINPTDAAFDFVPSYNEGTTRKWPAL